LPAPDKLNEFVILGWPGIVQAKPLLDGAVRIGEKDWHVGIAFVVNAAACRHRHSWDTANV